MYVSYRILSDSTELPSYEIGYIKFNAAGNKENCGHKNFGAGLLNNIKEIIFHSHQQEKTGPY